MRVRWTILCTVLSCFAADSARSANFVVTNALSSGPGSLRDAVLDANTSPPPNTITFNIPGPVPIVITSAATYELYQSMVIDATSQPGFTNLAPAIWLTDPGAVLGAFSVFASNCVIRGFQIQNFNSHGISLARDSNRVEGCLILSNNVGVYISGGEGNMVGGPAFTNFNRISGNTSHGIFILGPNTSNNVIMGNFVGVGQISDVRVPNGGSGIKIQNSPGNTLSSGFFRQVFSGNAQYGIEIIGADSASNRIIGNAIGTDHNAGNAVSNGYSGIYISSAPYTQIGGTNGGDRNYISGNGQHGVEVFFSTSAVGTRIEGNVIGLNLDMEPTPNRMDGIRLNAGDQAVIGGAENGQGNIISGNLGSGIYVGSLAKNGVAQGNSIGLDSTGFAAPNGGNGVFIQSANWLIGGTNTGARNIISGNGQRGVNVSFAENSMIQGNRIGVNSAGASRPNNSGGIRLDNSVGILVGGASSNAGNIIAGNIGSGIFLSDTTSNTVQGNLIGVLPGGVAVSNSAAGVFVIGGSGIVIGGSTPGERNVISGNGGFGNIEFHSLSTQVVIRGNFIGVDPQGTSAVDYGSAAGIWMGGRGHIIGGTNAGEGNVISGNGQHGIVLIGRDHRVQGNIIGLASNGLTVVSNRFSGIKIDGATNCLIGGATPLARNIIGGNSQGINFGSGSPTLHSIVGNYIGVGRDGTSAVTHINGDITFTQGGTFNQIGGRSPEDRNIIGGILFGSAAAQHNIIEGNYIGVDLLGRRITNVSAGVDFSAGASSNLIGGTAKGAGNVIGGVPYAVRVNDAGVTGNRFEGNFVGMWTNGVRLGNVVGTAGFYFGQGQQNTIGGTNPAAGNKIGYCARGIIIVASNRNALLGNTIVSNTSDVAIDLGGDGLFSGNDAFDVDGGANDGQNHPTVTNAQSFLGSTFAQGFLSSKASSQYRIEFFSSPPTFPLQAIRFLGFTTVTTAANGTGTFAAVLGGYTPTGYVVRATATDTNGNTSEIGVGSVVSQATDTDNDKMPNYWETQYGLNPSVSNSPTADADGDGIPDIEEYMADTNPSDPGSQFRIVDVASSMAGAWVTYPTSPNRNYDVEGSSNLLSGVWAGIATNMPGSGNLDSLADSAGETSRMYRARARIPPF